MQNSYTKNYLKIYLWQGISIVLNLASLFIVIPKLASVPSIYGIYTVCVSATIFLSYADLGFLNACFKYASECISGNNRTDEIRITGFGIFILIVFIALIAAIFLFLSFRPELLIKGLSAGSDHIIASRLLLILSLFSVSIVLQRILQLIFGIRVKDYLYQRINIIGSLIKIASVFYFFRDGHYDIVGYFLFVQLMNFLASFVGLWIARKVFNYDFVFFIKNLKYSREIFQKTKKLAFSSLWVTFAWILYYELDSFAIAKLLGATQVAFYAVGFALMSFLRTIFGTVYGPFNARFNHFIGLNDIEGLKSFYLQIILLTLPIVFLPVSTLIILMKPLIIALVGFKYQLSISIGIFLMLSYIPAFISNPAGILMSSLVKIKEMYLVNFLIVLVYWGGIILTLKIWGTQSFAIFKFISFFIAGIYYIIFSSRFTGETIYNFLFKILRPSILPVIVSILLLLFIRTFIPVANNKINLVYAILSGGGVSIVFLFIYYFTCNSFHNFCDGVFSKMNYKLIHVKRG